MLRGAIAGTNKYGICRNENPLLRLTVLATNCQLVCLVLPTPSQPRRTHFIPCYLMGEIKCEAVMTVVNYDDTMSNKRYWYIPKANEEGQVMTSCMGVVDKHTHNPKSAPCRVARQVPTHNPFPSPPKFVNIRNPTIMRWRALPLFILSKTETPKFISPLFFFTKASAPSTCPAPGATTSRGPSCPPRRR